MRHPPVPIDEVARLFDALPDVVFFVKNREGSYTHVNQTLVRRLGKRRREDVVGRDPEDLFPELLGASYRAQDRKVLDGRVIENQLEVHLFPDRAAGWCLTCKYPLREQGELVGVIGISRDLGRPDDRRLTYERLMRVIDYLESHYRENVHVDELAQLAEVSVAQLERHFRRVFQLSPRQMLTKLRIDAAIRMLHDSQPIAAIALACGYGDQSAFTRQFRNLTGLTPGQFRELRGGQPGPPRPV